MLIYPYLNEGLMLDWILSKLTAQGVADQRAQPLHRRQAHGHKLKTERNKDVISMLSNVRN